MSKKKHTSTKLVIGNWKMNPATVGKSQTLFLDIRKGLGRQYKDVEVVVAPPSAFISEMERLTPSRRIELCAQDTHYEKEGAHTGEVSTSMLKSVGVSSVIVGHSEKRAAGDSDEEVSKKVQAVLNGSLTVVLCVGEKKRDTHGHYLTHVEKQLISALRNIAPSKLKRVIVAYEPIWAIGTGKTATPEDAQEMTLFIKKVLSDMHGRTTAQKVRILYGGSVKPNNAEALLRESDIGGFLVGGASLKASSFLSIIHTAHVVNQDS